MSGPSTEPESSRKATMAIQPKTKKPEAKKAAKPTKAAKAKAAKPKAAKSSKSSTPRVEKNGKTRNGRVVELLLERKYTDEQIKAKINKEFAPLTVNNAAIPVARARLNEALSANQKVERLLEVDGKLIPKSKAPQKPKAKKRKPVDPKNDPLAKVGIKVKAKPKAQPKAAKPAAKPKEPTVAPAVDEAPAA